MSLVLTRVPVGEQEPEVRKHNFNEVSLGYTLEEAIQEAKRCIQCKRPRCVDGCPVNIRIPEFIDHIANGNIDRAAEIIKETNNLPAICGRVCPQEEQCEVKCILGIKGEPVAIGRLERFAADYALEKAKKGPVPMGNGIKVAIVGSGPAGLTAAADLAKYGYEAHIFEAFHEPGGVLIYGIPEFRLPESLVRKEIEGIKDLGVQIYTNIIIGKTITIDELLEQGYEAVFIGSGAGLPRFMNIPGENLNGVYSANEYLTRINLMKAYDFPNNHTPIKVGHRVAVVGGGNVAMDAARSALRLGADEVRIVYRRSEEEMPARSEEIHHAKEEGIVFDTLANPIEIMGDNGWVTGLKCIRMELGEPDSSGRRRPMKIQGSEFIQDVDIVIMAIGTSPNPLIVSTTDDLAAHGWGGIIVDEETGSTSKDGVYAGGDAVTGAATVILAMGAGKKAAKAIHERLKAREDLLLPL
ncbi:MAG TPA: NADPH-dependent glutamate synthase [Clostridia bacterium]|nr:NADPH-dependent glutamate synthase [Clostridia bacterium]